MPSTATRPAPTRRTATGRPPAAHRAAASRPVAARTVAPASRHHPAVRVVAILLVLGLVLGLFSSLLAVA